MFFCCCDSNGRKTCAKYDCLPDSHKAPLHMLYAQRICCRLLSRALCSLMLSHLFLCNNRAYYVSGERERVSSSSFFFPRGTVSNRRHSPSSSSSSSRVASGRTEQDEGRKEERKKLSPVQLPHFPFPLSLSLSFPVLLLSRTSPFCLRRRTSPPPPPPPPPPSPCDGGDATPKAIFT